MVEFSSQMVVFGILGGLIVLGAYKVVASDYVTHAALFLALFLAAVAGLFILLNADFLAMVQILIYIGAVVAIFVFAVMLSELRELGRRPDQQNGGFLGELRRAVRSPYWGLVPVTLAAALLVLVVASFRGVTGVVPTEIALENTASVVGQSLFTTYFVPFEVASLLLLVAMIGAIILAKGEGTGQ